MAFQNKYILRQCGGPTSCKFGVSLFQTSDDFTIHGIPKLYYNDIMCRRIQCVNTSMTFNNLI